MIEVGSPFWLYMNDFEEKQKLQKIVDYMKAGYDSKEACNAAGVDPRMLTSYDIKWINSKLEEED